MINAISQEYLVQQAWLCLHYARAREAIVILEALSVLAPGDAYVQRTLSYAYLQNKDYQKCLEQLNRSLGTQKSRIDRVIRIRAHWGLRQHGEARRLLKQMGGRLRDVS
jgi:predicted Zn-dependent protease